MFQHELIAGIDIGTSRCRGMIWNMNGEKVYEVHHAYPTHVSKEGWHEHDPELVKQAFLDTLQNIICFVSSLRRNNTLIITLSSYLNSVIPVDKHGKPLSNCLIWTDRRAADIVKEEKQKINIGDLYKRTGCPLHPMYPIWKIVWFRINEPNIYSKVEKWISIKEYIIHKLWGEYLVDWSVASSTGLFNIHNCEWDATALEIAELQASYLSTPVSPLTQLPPLPREHAKTASNCQIHFVIGGGDGPLSCIGSGAVVDGVADNTVGSGGAIRCVSFEPLLDRERRTFCYVLMPNMWVVGGVTPGGVVLDWFIDALCESSKTYVDWEKSLVYQTIEHEAAQVPPGSDNLIFLPFVTGAYCPSWNPNTCGVFWGIKPHHTKKHLIRAVIEGLAYERYRAMKAVESVIGSIRAAYLSGGFARSTLWGEIITNVLGIEHRVPSVIETSALGAAFLGGLSYGLFTNFEQINVLNPIIKTLKPQLDISHIYQNTIDVYCSLLNSCFQKGGENG
ncbi:MAG: gluconokinase [Candidatus Bathyarchaeia archaeon]